MIWAALPSWIWLGGMAAGLLVQVAGWAACIAALLALYGRRGGDDLLLGINLNFAIYVPVLQFVALIWPEAADALLSRSEASVMVFVWVVLVLRLLTGSEEDRWRRGALAVWAGVAAMWLLCKVDPAAGDLALVLGVLFAVERLWRQFGLKVLVAAAGAGTLPMRAD